jgi:beta-lactam-binding protein with PASTA domain
VPDLRLLPPHEAEARLAEFGLRARFEGRGPRALSQLPAAGEAVERGACVAVWLAAPVDSTGPHMPDLTGVVMREALRRMTVLEARTRIEGHGAVVRQTPSAGEALPPGARCVLWCQSVGPTLPAVPGAAVPAVTAAAGRGLAAVAGRGP